MTTTLENPTITRALVPDDRRADFVDTLFGIHFPMQLEPYIFSVAAELSSDYDGGYWEFYALSNGGFYMAPDDDEPFIVRSENGYEGTMSADALGITACLYAYSRLSFVAGNVIGEVYARQYHLLREYMMEHREATAILGATD